MAWGSEHADFCSGFVINLEALRDIANRTLPGSGRPLLERTPTGGSTLVYRIERGGTVQYLRLAESATASLAPEALAHRLLRDRGACVPDIVHFEPFDQRLQRSALVTSAIPGWSLAERHRGVDVAAVARAAGRDLAVINSLAVDGFGWIRRDRPPDAPLAAAMPTLRAFALDDLETYLARMAPFLTGAERRAIPRVVTSHEHFFDAEDAVLAHGDFDATHIFHHDGAYSGIIDFGEIRGADRFYDLGHAALHDGETIPDQILPSLLAGYGEAAPLPPDHERRIRLWSLLIGLRALARGADRPDAAYLNHLTRGIRQATASLET
jgi:aminoglycoside phosphotransferase